MRLVTDASAEISVIGSKLAMYCAERDSASMLASRTQTLSAKNDHVELAALGGLRDLDVVLEVDRRRRPARSGWRQEAT